MRVVKITCHCPKVDNFCKYPSTKRSERGGWSKGHDSPTAQFPLLCQPSQALAARRGSPWSWEHRVNANTRCARSRRQSQHAQWPQDLPVWLHSRPLTARVPCTFTQVNVLKNNLTLPGLPARPAPARPAPALLLPVLLLPSSCPPAALLPSCHPYILPSFPPGPSGSAPLHILCFWQMVVRLGTSGILF